MRNEPVAISCRVSRSFVRVGHFELYARRAEEGDATALLELEQLARHAVFRDFPAQVPAGETAQTSPLAPMLLGMARDSAQRFAELGANWVRVGYTQSNFNADNCLVSGTTVDYGPFGFIEEYSRGWGMCESSPPACSTGWYSGRPDSNQNLLSTHSVR